MKFVTLSILCLVALTAFASDTSVTNTITTSASTGGNNSSSGTVSEGKASASVRVYTEINGEVVTDFEEKREAEEGGSVEIVKELRYETGSSSVKAIVEVGDKRLEIRDKNESSGTSSEVSMGNQEVGIGTSTTTEEVRKPMRKMFVSLRNWLKNVFKIFKIQ